MDYDFFNHGLFSYGFFNHGLFGYGFFNRRLFCYGFNYFRDLSNRCFGLGIGICYFISKGFSYVFYHSRFLGRFYCGGVGFGRLCVS